MNRPGLISIWFFIGMLLLAYGILVLGAGLYDVFVPPADPVVLNKLHAGVWSGVLLIALGAFYPLRLSARRGKK